MNKKIIVLLLFTISFIIIACEKFEPNAPADDEVLEGPVAGLTPAEQAQFLKGDEAFSEVFTSAKGLGPLFVANSCVSCHAGDGKGTVI